MSDEAGLEALAEQGVIDCVLSVGESRLESLDAARGLTQVKGVDLTENELLTDIDFLDELVAPFDLIVADTPLRSEQALGENVKTASLANTDVVTLTVAGSTLESLRLERNTKLVKVDGPQMTTLGTVSLVDLPQAVVGDILLNATSCRALSVTRLPLASTFEIEALAERCGLEQFHHCGNLDDLPCD